MRFEVCDRTRDFQNSVVTAGGQCQRFKYSFQQERRVFIEFAAIAKQIPIQACVAGDACSGIPLYLDFPRGADAPADRIRGLALFPLRHVGKRNGGDFYLNVDTVEQRTGYPTDIAVYILRRTATGFGWMPVKTAFAGVHGADKHNRAGIFHRGGDAGDAHRTVLQRLT